MEISSLKNINTCRQSIGTLTWKFLRVKESQSGIGKLGLVVDRLTKAHGLVEIQIAAPEGNIRAGTEELLQAGFQANPSYSVMSLSEELEESRGSLRR